jgi:HD-GYP domain-containing protein (c-di-GMP phosphodiesterase class II)/HAMP domain-containing protein
MLIIGGFAYYEIDKSRYMTHLQQAIDTDVDQLAEGLVLPLWNVDEDQVDKNIRSIMKNKSVYAVEIYPEVGMSPRIMIRDENWGIRTSTQAIQENGLIVVSRNVLFGANALGKIKIYATKRFINEEIKEEIIIIFFSVMILEVFFILILYLLLWRIVFKPLNILEQYAGMVSSGNKRHLKLSKIDALGEIGSLYGSIESMVSLLESRYVELQLSESRFRSLFENSPVSIWEYDFSDVKKYLDNIKVQGIKDIRSLIKKDLEKIASLIRVVHVNQATIKLLEAQDAKELTEGPATYFVSESYPTLEEVMIALYENKTIFVADTVVKTLSGEKKYTNVLLAVMPGHEENLSQVLVLLVDITDRKQAEEKLQQTLESLRKAVGTTIQVLVSAVESRDSYTSGHQSRSADLACAIATEMGLAQDKIEGIRMAGSIHDIGKLSIPAEILAKPTKLTDIEFSLIKEHSRCGYGMLKDVESPWPLAQIVYQHHERMDGSGYPRNLKGDEILMEARIIAVADVVEAIASHRPYRAALGIEIALEEIEKNKGLLYDKDVADACLRLFRKKSYSMALKDNRGTEDENILI